MPVNGNRMYRRNNWRSWPTNDHFYQSGYALDYTRQMNTSYNEDLDRIFLFLNNQTNWKRNGSILFFFFSSSLHWTGHCQWCMGNTHQWMCKERETNCLFSLTFSFLNVSQGLWKWVDQICSIILQRRQQRKSWWVDDMYPFRSFNRSMDGWWLNQAFFLITDKTSR